MAKRKIEAPDQNIYNFKNPDEYAYKIKKGLSEEIVKEISKQILP